jgi:hypothetical protein
MTLVSMSLVIVHDRMVEYSPLYLHVYGTMVDSSHDPARPNSAPVSWDGIPWTRTASVSVYSGRSFGFHTPNDRRPLIAIQGNLRCTFTGRYQGRISWSLDDSNLTYSFEEQVDLELNRIVYINDYYNAYLLSASEDPYFALEQAIQPDDPRMIKRE